MHVLPGNLRLGGDVGGRDAGAQAGRGAVCEVSTRSARQRAATTAFQLCLLFFTHAYPLAPPPPRQDTSATSMLLDAMSASAAQQAAWAMAPGPYTQEQCPVACSEQQACSARYACWAPPFTYADPLLNLFLP